MLFFINEGRELLLKQSLYRTVVFLIIVIYFPVFSVNLFQDMTLNLIPEYGKQPDIYFDEELYKNRFKIEQANGWLDGYKDLIMRYEYLDVTWIGMLLLGFISKFLKKV